MSYFSHVFRSLGLSPGAGVPNKPPTSCDPLFHHSEMTLRGVRDNEESFENVNILFMLFKLACMYKTFK